MQKAMGLQQQFREAIRLANYPYSNEKSYWTWVRGFLFFHEMKDPSLLSGEHTGKYLTHLVMERNISISTQQALSALVFLYRNVLGWEDIKISDWCLPPAQGNCPWSFPSLRHRLCWHILMVMYGWSLY